MAKYPAFILVVLLSISNCFADTFVHPRTGETFNGYLLQQQKDGKTQVRVEKKGLRYIDIGEYKIERNALGRRNEVSIFSITGSIDLICEARAFEQAITFAADKGPLFILIEIDTQGGRIDLVHRISSAIAATDNCTTVAYITGDKFRGAFAEGAIAALACDKIYMRQGTSIGAMPLHLEMPVLNSETAEGASGSQEDAAEVDSAWLAYCVWLANKSNRPELLVKAMLDKNIEAVEISEEGERIFIDSKDKSPNQAIVRTWSEKGSLLTLTAAQAVEVGIADGIAASREELLASLNAAKAEQVPDTRVLRARRDFVRAQNRIDERLVVIAELQQQASDIIADVNTLDKEIDRTNEILSRRGIVWWPYVGPEAYELDRMLIARDGLLGRLVLVLESLRRNCEGALSLAEDQPDLQQKAEAVTESLEFADATFKRIRPRLQYSQPRYYRRRW